MMVNYCAAFNCYNSALRKGISFHKFPNNVKLSKEWVIRMRRLNFVPTVHSKLCSEHFTPDQFTKDSDPEFRASIGLPPTNERKRKLLDNAVPTVFNFSTKENEMVPAPKRARKSVEKREHLRRRHAYIYQEFVRRRYRSATHSVGHDILGRLKNVTFNPQLGHGWKPKEEQPSTSTILSTSTEHIETIHPSSQAELSTLEPETASAHEEPPYGTPQPESQADSQHPETPVTPLLTEQPSESAEMYSPPQTQGSQPQPDPSMMKGVKGLKEQFANIVFGASSMVLTHFMVWLDEKMAEFKVNGSMNMDTGSVDTPKWIKNYSILFLVCGAHGEHIPVSAIPPALQAVNVQEQTTQKISTPLQPMNVNLPNSQDIILNSQGHVASQCSTHVGDRVQPPVVVTQKSTVIPIRPGPLMANLTVSDRRVPKKLLLPKPPIPPNSIRLPSQCVHMPLTSNLLLSSTEPLQTSTCTLQNSESAKSTPDLCASEPPPQEELLQTQQRKRRYSVSVEQTPPDDKLTPEFVSNCDSSVMSLTIKQEPIDNFSDTISFPSDSLNIDENAMIKSEPIDQFSSESDMISAASESSLVIACVSSEKEVMDPRHRHYTLVPTLPSRRSGLRRRSATKQADHLYDIGLDMSVDYADESMDNSNVDDADVDSDSDAGNVFPRHATAGREGNDLQSYSGFTSDVTEDESFSMPQIVSVRSLVPASPVTPFVYVRDRNVLAKSDPRTVRSRLQEARQSSVSEASDSGGGNEPRVKRPMNAFMIWSKIARKKLAAENPKMHNSELSKLLGVKWMSLSAAEKEPYKKMQIQVVQQHMEKHPDYKYKPCRQKKGSKPWLTGIPGKDIKLYVSPDSNKTYPQHVDDTDSQTASASDIEPNLSNPSTSTFKSMRKKVESRDMELD